MFAGLRSRWMMPLRVRGLERVGELFCDRKRFGQRYRTLRDPILKRLALDELENERLGLRSILEGVNRRDVWVVQRRQQFGFPPEARQSLRIARKPRC